MAGEDDDLIITLDSLDEPVDSTLTTDEPTGRRPAIARAAGGETDEGGDAPIVDNLRGQLDTLKRRGDEQARALTEAGRREQAVRRQAVELAERNRTLETHAADTRVAALDSEIASANSEAESIAAALKAAADAAETEKIPALQRKLARAEARILLAEDKKASLATGGEVEPAPRPTEGRVEPKRPAATPREPSDQEKFETVLAACTPATAAWLREHPEYVTDPEKQAEASMIHHRALRAGYKADTPEYFDFAEQELGIAGDPDPTARRPAVPKKEPNGAQPRPRPRVGAPGRGGDTPSGGGSGTIDVALTREERNKATDGTIVWNVGPKKGQPIGTKEYARRKAVLQKEGRFQYSDAS